MKTPSRLGASSPAPVEPPKPAATPATNPLLAGSNPLLGGSNPLLAFAKKGGWKCDACMLQNEDGVGKCKACETPKPGGGEVAKPPAAAPSAGELMGWVLFLRGLKIEINRIVELRNLL